MRNLVHAALITISALHDLEPLIAAAIAADHSVGLATPPSVSICADVL